MTLSHVDDQNFWGGNSYRHGRGYIPLDNVGGVRHQDFTDFVVAEDSLALREGLHWRTWADEHWITEQRSIRIHGVDREAGSWMLDFDTELTNARDEPLRLGSPTTEGRELAGYTGLFWRGPRGWTGGSVYAADGAEGPTLMGEASPWLAYTGEHDEVDGGGTLLVLDRTEDPTVDTRWFVRNDPFPAVNPSLAFFDPVILQPGDSLTLHYRIVVGDAIWSRDRIEQVVRDQER
jgi:hypothetical protein